MHSIMHYIIIILATGKTMASLPNKRALHNEFQDIRPDNPDAMLNWDDNFTDLRECSSEFQQAFMYAWKV